MKPHDGSPERFELRSLDIKADQLESLRNLFPELRSESGGIDFDRLKQMLGGAVDTGKERYGLSWPGKGACFTTIQSTSYGTLLPERDKSLNFDRAENALIKGDNLEVLKLLQKSYLCKIKVIYIDPPYNTGNDFIYPDNYAESLQTYLRYTGQTDSSGRRFGTNQETDGRFHSKWLNMMYPRLYLARSLLANDGVIFISIDDHEVCNLKKICEEIFGEENFIAQVPVITNMKGRNDKKNIATCHEYILIFGKSADSLLRGLPLTDEQKAEFKFVDRDGRKYALRDLRKRGGPDRRQDRPNMFFPLYYNRIGKSCALTRSSEDDIEIFPKKGDGSDGRWRWGKDKVASNLDKIEVRMSERSGRWDADYRVYLNELRDDEDDNENDDDGGDSGAERTSKAKSFWMGPEFSSDAGKRSYKRISPDLPYDFPKSVDLVKRCVALGGDAECIVLDFFAGSGTTAQAVLELNAEDNGNRKFILVQLPEPIEGAHVATIADITITRVVRAIDELNHGAHAGRSVNELGFRVFRLDTSNFETWDAHAEINTKSLQRQLELYVDHVRSGRSQEEILYELLVKSGFTLTTRVETLDLAGKTIFIAGGGLLVICLERILTMELVEAIANMNPGRVVFLDKGFAGNDQLKANAAQLFKAKGVESFKTV